MRTAPMARPRIERTLKKLVWAKRILLIDSGSTDDTLALARRHPQVDVVEHSFSDFAITVEAILFPTKTRCAPATPF